MDEFEGIALSGEEDLGFSPNSLDSFDLDLADLTAQDGFTYPALLLHGVLFMDCLRVLQAQKRKSFREVDTWVELPESGEFQNIGTLQLDSDMLLVLRQLRIGATIYWEEGTTETIDLSDPERIENFI